LPVEPLLVVAMFATYVLMRRHKPRYAVAAVLVTGALVTVAGGGLRSSELVLAFAAPQWVSPQFSWAATFSLALPLVLVALTGQFMPGMAVLRNAGYSTPASPLISASALGGLLLAPFGCHGLNLAAVTASLCTGREAHADPRRRYVAALAGSVLYLLLGVAGATLMALFGAFPAALVAALAGLALYGAISDALARSLAEPAERDAGLFTFLVSASGGSFLGLSAAFWGLLFGLAAHALVSLRRPLRRAPAVD
jgi:benzoate membrane transport protein